METVTHPCPNCNAELTYDPDRRLFVCGYCQSSFSDPRTQASAPEHPPKRIDRAGMRGYACPNCGAEVVCEANAASALCYYCKTPVVLGQRVSGDMEPDRMIPFAIGKERATEQFRKLLRSKWFAPPKLHAKSQIESLTGIYLPHWAADCGVAGRRVSDASTIRVWRSGDTEYTETSRYRLYRAGTAQVSGITRLASSRADRALIEAAGPYDGAGEQRFSTAYLSGYQAQVRDLEFEQLRGEIEACAEKELEEQLAEASSWSGAVICTESKAAVRSLEKRYLLYPVWMLTCQSGSKSYHFAINGQTGKIVGEVPLCLWKLFIASAAVFCGSFWLISRLIGGIL